MTMMIMIDYDITVLRVIMIMMTMMAMTTMNATMTQ